MKICTVRPLSMPIDRKGGNFSIQLSSKPAGSMRLCIACVLEVEHEGGCKEADRHDRGSRTDA